MNLCYILLVEENLAKYKCHKKRKYEHVYTSVKIIIYIWPGRPGFNPRLSHTKDSKKWYLMPPCLTLSVISCRSRIKWSNPGKRVMPSPTPWCCSYRKGILWVNFDYGCQLFYFMSDCHLIPLMFSVSKIIFKCNISFLKNLMDT